ncbi:MAG: hypothetical protein LBV45_00505 [Xanthomonadaceae bacterium]|jgi:ABC-type glycerol-3-phosphate transport system permease component|nr:hypothetical protein [Xanthomonadaceae bacterium]
MNDAELLLISILIFPLIFFIFIAFVFIKVKKPVMRWAFWLVSLVVAIPVILLTIPYMQTSHLFNFGPLVNGLIICGATPGISLLIGAAVAPKKRL